MKAGDLDPVRLTLKQGFLYFVYIGLDVRKVNRDGAGPDPNEPQRIVVIHRIDLADFGMVEIIVSLPRKLFIEVLAHDDHRFLAVFADMDW